MNEQNIKRETVQFEGNRFEVTGETALHHNSRYGDHYSAEGIDAEGETVQIIWEINHPEFTDLEDETEACDWERPVAVQY